MVLAVLVLPSDSSAAVQATFYVAPNGGDDNPGAEAKPFVTVEKAQKAVHWWEFASGTDT